MTVRFGLRAKVVLVSLAVSAVVSAAMGAVLYLRSYGAFFGRLGAEKLNLARVVSLSLAGDRLADWMHPAALEDPSYQADLAYLRSVKATDEDISFAYVVRYDEALGCHVYVLDGNVNAENVMWIETESVFLIARIAQDGGITIEWEQTLYGEDFSVETDHGTARVHFARTPGGPEVLLDEQPLFRVVQAWPLELETVGGRVSASTDRSEHTVHGAVELAGRREPLTLHLGLRGDPESVPGEVYNQNDPESIESLRQYAESDQSYASAGFEGSTYGRTIFVYTPVHGSAGRVEGILCLEVWARQAEAYSRTILVSTTLVAIVAFALSVAVYLIMIEELVVKGIARLTVGVREIGAGNLDHRVVLRRTDEIGLLAQTLNDMTRGLKEKERVKDLFGKYVQKEVAEMALASEANFAGVKRDATVLFCDIRSFTTLSESLDARDLVIILNRYFARMAEEVVRNHGVLDKYIGDAIMAHFGVLGGFGEPADDALLCGIAMVRALAVFNAEQQRAGGRILRIGIGVHSGGLIAGNMGSANRMEYTVIGDTVNLASRVEGLTRLFGVPLVATGETMSRLRDVRRYASRELDRVVVKGKSVPVVLHEVFDGDPEDVRQGKLADLPRHRAALEAYHARRFAEAGRILEPLSSAHPDDGVYAYFLDRCRFYGSHPPGEGWDGAMVMTVK